MTQYIGLNIASHRTSIVDTKQKDCQNCPFLLVHRRFEDNSTGY